MCLNIKRKLALCMVVVMLLTLFVGCTKEEQNPAGTISDFESQAHIQVSAPEDESTAEEASKTPLTGEFVVSEKKYDYKDANLMLLYVENQTNRHFSVKIKGKYLDENGEVIKEETQAFAAFPSGWSNHFIFYPNCAFDSFTYELETGDYTAESRYSFDNRIILTTSDSDGVPLASYIGFNYEKKLNWMLTYINVGTSDLQEGRMLYLNAEMTNDHPTVTIQAQFHVLVLDSDGNIYIADYDFYDSDGYRGSNRTATGPIGSEDNGRVSFDGYLKDQPRGGDESIPDNVQGVFTAIFAISEVFDYDNYYEQGKELARLDYGIEIE